MIAKAFENPRYLSRCLTEHNPELPVADAEPLHVALGDGVEDGFVVRAEKVETSIAAADPGKLYKAVFKDENCTTTGVVGRCAYAFTRAGELQPVTVTVNCGG